MNAESMNLFAALPHAVAIVPFAFALASLATFESKPFVVAQVVSAAAFLLATLGFAGVLLGGPADVAAHWGNGAAWLRVDLLAAAMVALVTFVGHVIVRFARRYLAGDAGQERFERFLMAALAAVTFLVVSNHLALSVVAWTATSLALHQLLTFFPDRPAALVAAHKKFLISRAADVCLFSATVLIGLHAGHLHLDALALWAQQSAEMPWQVHFAALLLVAGVGLRTAQLPFHGWLTQVMEAPTPVSAFLHAGVVNIGGYVLIRMAPVMEKSPIALTALVAMGGTTVLLAALVMMTRSSIKAKLAWSTCAQMGFMLVECGLGLYDLAFVHLVAHSLYKAHAFLSSGSVVDAHRIAGLLKKAARPGLFSLGLAPLAAFGVVAGVYAVAGVDGTTLSAAATMVVLGVGLASWLGAAGSWGRRVALALGGAGLTGLYITWHQLFSWVQGAGPGTPGSDTLLGWRVAMALGFMVALYLVQGILLARPSGRFARMLYPYLLAGFSLDDVFTRLTFRWWPARVPDTRPFTNAGFVAGPARAAS